VAGVQLSAKYLGQTVYTNDRTDVHKEVNPSASMCWKALQLEASRDSLSSVQSPLRLAGSGLELRASASLVGVARCRLRSRFCVSVDNLRSPAQFRVFCFSTFDNPPQRSFK